MISYKGTPLFGEDSSVSHTSEFFAIAGTVLFWLLFLIFSFVIKPGPKKPEYKEVQIVLSSTPVVQKTEEAPAPAEQAAAPSQASEPQVVETPKVEAPAPKVETPNVETPAPKAETKPLVKETPKAKTEPKSQPKKETPKAQPQKTQTPSPAKKVEPVEQVLYQDPMEAFNAQTKQQPKKAVDWDAMFADDEADLASSSNQVKKVSNNEPAFSGSAGTAASATSEKVTSTSSSSRTQSQNASASTSKALEGIKNSTFKGNASNGVQSETNVKTKNSGSGRVELEMSNGRSRALIKPANPVINLSAQAAATIDASKNVTINFKVLEAGNVTEIKITPESILSIIVREEIKAQISQWLFEAADYTANANFEYKIVKE